MLTPQDLQEVSFEKAKIGGYVMKSVDEFLEPLMDDYVTLYKENAVLKSKMRLLVERLEEYRSNEAEMKSAMEETQRTCDSMLADAKRRSEELVQKAEEEAKNRNRDLDASVTNEQERLRLAKEATAEFVASVEAHIARQQQALEALKGMDLPKVNAKPIRRAYDYESERDPAPRRGNDAEAIAAQIEENVGRITGGYPSPDPTAVTRIMPPLDERTTAKFANLKFGRNYQP